MNLQNIRPAKTKHLFKKKPVLFRCSTRAQKSFWAIITNYQDIGPVYNYTKKRSKSCILARFDSVEARDSYLVTMAGSHELCKSLLEGPKSSFTHVQYLAVKTEEIRYFFAGMARSDYDIYIESYPFHQ